MDDKPHQPKPKADMLPPRKPPGRNSVAGACEDDHEQVRVIDKDGRQLGIMILSEAMKVADSERAELVKITQTVSPPVYRMVDSDEHQKPKET
jgi:hypothetical protein